MDRQTPKQIDPIFPGSLPGAQLDDPCGFLGICQVIFDDNIENGEFQRVGTTPPIEKALVNKNSFFTKTGKFLIFVVSGISQMFKACFWPPQASLLETNSPATFQYLFFDIVPNNF